MTKNWTAEKRGLWMLSAIGGDGYRAMTKPARYECYETLETTGEEDIPQSMYEKFVETIRGDAKNARKSAAEAKASEETAAASAGAAADSAAESKDAAQRAKASAEESAVSAEKSAASENAAKKYSESAKDAIANAKKDYSGGYLKTYDLTAVQADWKPLDPARGPYHYSCDIPVEELTDQFSPFAATGLESYAAAVAAGVANAVETRNGALRLFAMRVPAADIDLVLTLFGVGTLSYELTLPVTDWKQMEVIRFIGNSRFLQCLHIPLVALLSLRVVGFEDAHNAPVSQFNQVSGRKIGSPAVVQKNLRPVQKLGMYSLYKYIGDMIAVEHLIQIHMPAENLALARLDDEPVDILLQKLLETLCLKAS